MGKRIPSRITRGIFAIGKQLAITKKRMEDSRAAWREHDERVALMRELNQYTYAVQHNPHCPSRFLVRLHGSNMVLDYKPHTETADVLGYGKTLAEAAQNALEACKKQFPHRF